MACPHPHPHHGRHDEAAALAAIARDFRGTPSSAPFHGFDSHIFIIARSIAVASQNTFLQCLLPIKYIPELPQKHLIC
ncbi:hypothetical protein GJV26_18805 [Massilia dura]|uniref:Uncharacterized protein n=1 Tax=Pseudoduganella dura TaxID=321982 RepID=A0A6I3XLE4_9BURK|nr:hypothetical protein [Pseudoduganella dura]MUI14491.1 hypothetical protein [Pseudoduganella dura]